MKKLLTTTTAVLLLATLASAQMFFGTFQGKCTDVNGQPIAGATIHIQDKETGRKYELKTDKNGEFKISSISSGTYEVSLIVNGQTVRTSGNQRPNPNQPTQIDFDLRVQSGAPLSAEQKQKLGEAQKKNADIQKENEKRKAANALLQQVEANMAMNPPNVDQALADAQQITQLVPDVYLGWATLGEVASVAKKHDLAIQGNEKAIELLQAEPDPTGKNKEALASLHNNLGQAYGRSGKTQEAIAEYSAAAQINPPGAAQYYFNLGAVLTNTGKVDDANTAFDKAIAANPGYAEAYYQKGINLLGKGTVDPKTGKVTYPPEAAQSLQKYLEIAPTGKNAQAAKDVLASMGDEVETVYKKKKK
jgi:tetratricopeptide (TPR) repeat protein